MIYGNQPRASGDKSTAKLDIVGRDSGPSSSEAAGNAIPGEPEESLTDGVSNAPFASEAVRLERLDDSLNKIRKLMEPWDHVDLSALYLSHGGGWEPDVEEPWEEEAE